MEKQLSNLQQHYYNERVEFMSGWGVAVPYGMIRKWAEEKDDEECKKWFKNGIPKEYADKHKLEM